MQIYPKMWEETLKILCKAFEIILCLIYESGEILGKETSIYVIMGISISQGTFFWCCPDLGVYFSSKIRIYTLLLGLIGRRSFPTLNRSGRPSLAGHEILAFGSHCKANFQLILDCFIPKL